MARLHAVIRHPLRVLVALMLPLWLLGACSGSQPTYVDEKVDAAEINYRARHEEMLRIVLLRPAQMEAQRLERERLDRERDKSQWDAVMARHDAFVERQIDTQARDQAAFEAMLARQHTVNSTRDAQRTERWAQYLEQRAPAGAGSPGATGGAPPATP